MYKQGMEIDWKSLTETELIVLLANLTTPKQFYNNLMKLCKMFKVELK